MYKIIGGDGNEYGPVSTEQLHQWIAEGRANNQTRVQREGELEWQPLAAFPEFAAALTAQTRAQLGAVAATTPPPFSSGATLGGASPLAEGDYVLDMGGCISRGWELVKNNLGVLVVGFLVYLLVAGAVGGLSAIPIIGPVFSIVNLVISGPLLGGVFYMFLKAVRGQPTEAGDVFAGFRKGFAQLLLGQVVSSLLVMCCFIPALITALLTVIPATMHHQPPNPQQLGVVIAVAVLCLFPAIFLRVNWMFTLPLIIDRELNFWTAMKMSWQRVKLHWWQVFGLSVLVGLINLAGVLLCCVGLLVTMPVSFAALMFAYETIFSGKTTRNN